MISTLMDGGRDENEIDNTRAEAEDFKDISPFAIVTLAEFYGVSTDYLLGLTENKNPTNAELQALHLRDDAADAIRDGKYNKRLLSGLLVHDKFQQLMIDAEVYVDRIANSRINDMNAMLEAVRQQVIQQYAAEGGDLQTAMSYEGSPRQSHSKGKRRK